MNLLERLHLAFKLVNRLGEVDAVIAKIEALGGILDRLQATEKALTANDTLLSLAGRLEALDGAVKRIEAAANPPPIPAAQPKPTPPVKEDLQEWHRLQLLSKFVQLAGKAKDIEIEWQKVQQEEHDASFAFQTLKDEDSQTKFIYKKGVVDGIKWCVNRFS